MTALETRSNHLYPDHVWEVEQLLASRVHYGKLQYQVRWKGWSADPEWYPAADFKNSPEATKQFHDENHDKSGYLRG